MERFELSKASATAFHQPGRGVWVPAPVHNCALGRNDGYTG